MQFFEVTKVVRFGRVLRRVLLLNREEDGSGGVLKVVTKEGSVRREVAIHNVISVEKSEGDCKVVLRFLAAAHGEEEIGEASGMYIFDSERLRDLFIGTLSAMNPRLHFVEGAAALTVGADGKAAPTPRQRAKTVTAQSTPRIARAKSIGGGLGRRSVASEEEGGSGDRAGQQASGASTTGDGDRDSTSASDGNTDADGATDRSVASRMFGSSGGGGGGGGRQPAGRKFFVMQYNTFGFREPRVASFASGGALLQLRDGTDTLRSEFSLSQLRDVLVHAVDDTVMSMSFAVGTAVLGC